MQHRFFKGIRPQKYKEQMQNAPALIPISSGESIPGELLLSRAHFRFDSIANFETLNYIYKLLKKAATYTHTKEYNIYFFYYYHSGSRSLETLGASLVLS